MELAESHPIRTPAESEPALATQSEEDVECIARCNFKVAQDQNIRCRMAMAPCRRAHGNSSLSKCSAVNDTRIG